MAEPDDGEPDDGQPGAQGAPARRRIVVVTITLAVGTALLAVTLSAPQGSARFFVFALLAGAAWLVGSLLSGPVVLGGRHVGTARTRDIVPAVVLGAAAFAFFLAGAFVGHHIPVLRHALHAALDRADTGSRVLVLIVAVLNGVGEEAFFRGALFATLRRVHPVVLTTVIYMLVTLATGNLALVAAAGAMGTVLATERAATRGVLAPAITHVTWSILMVVALPR